MANSRNAIKRIENIQSISGIAIGMCGPNLKYSYIAIAPFKSFERLQDLKINIFTGMPKKLSFFLFMPKNFFRSI